MHVGIAQQERWNEEQAGTRLPQYVPPRKASVRPSLESEQSTRPGQAEASNGMSGVVGRGPPAVHFNSKSQLFTCDFLRIVDLYAVVPVFDCTQYFQPRQPGQFADMRSLSDFFSQSGAEICPRITGVELRKKSFVAVCYTASKWRGKDSGDSGDKGANERRGFNLGLNIRAVYLLVNGPKNG